MIHRRLLLVRHGRTDWNRTFRYQGTTDVPLDAEGRDQARRLGMRLNRQRLASIVVSPLSRAMETAEIVAAEAASPAKRTIADGLAEIDFGQWEGLTVKEVMERHHDHYRAWRADPLAVEPPGGEPFLQAVERVGEALRPLLDGPEGTTLVVCHGGTIRAALVFLLQVPAALVWKIRQDNCALTAIDLWDQTPMLAFSNDQVHLLVDEGLIGTIPLAR